MKRLPRSSPGVSLIVTLMMMAILVLMVVGLAGVMRNEQAAGRNLTYTVVAEQMAELGARQGMATLLQYSTSSLGRPSATGPGWFASNGTVLPLFSTNAAGQLKNLEEIGTNSLILSLPTGTRGRLPVHWTNVVGPDGIVIGRHAWWVDDEGGKINLNFVGGANGRVFANLTNFPLAAGYAGTAVTSNGFLFVDNFNSGQWTTADGIRANALAARTHAFATTESLKDTNILNLGANAVTAPVYRRTKGHVTVWSSNTDLNPWGQAKLSLTNFTSVANITNPANFSNLLSRSFAHPNLNSLFGSDLRLKYGGGDAALGSKVLQQTLANAYEALQPTNSTAPPLSGATGTNVPTDFLAVSPRSALLNEVAIAATYNLNTAANELQIQIWVLPELVTGGTNDIPFENTSTFFAVPNNGIRVVSATAGGQTIPAFGNFYSLTTNVNAPARRTGTISATGFYTNRTWSCFEYTWSPGRGTGPANFRNNAGRTTQLTLQVDLPSVVLRQGFGGTTNVSDWFQESGFVTFSFPGNMEPNGRVPDPSFSASMQPSVNLPSGLSANSYLGRAKTDPRARNFSSWSNAAVVWTNLPATPGAENTTTAVGSNRLNLPLDVMRASISALREGKVWSLPGSSNWVNTNSGTNAQPWMVQGSNFPSVACLGYIHTGLPWRTLKFSAQETDPMPPDWILNDLLTAAASATSTGPRINLNNQIWALPAGGGLPAPVTNRLPTVLSLLAPLSTPSNAATYPIRWAATNFGAAWGNLATNTNVSRWIPGSYWNRFRQGATSDYTRPGLFFFSGELAEINGVGNAGTTDEEREAALMAAGGLLTTRSDTFSVWSAGQGLAVNTNRGNRMTVMGEVRKQTVFQRIPQLDANGNVTGYRLKLLYTRNHVVE